VLWTIVEIAALIVLVPISLVIIGVCAFAIWPLIRLVLIAFTGFAVWFVFFAESEPGEAGGFGWLIGLATLAWAAAPWFSEMEDEEREVE